MYFGNVVVRVIYFWVHVQVSFALHEQVGEGACKHVLIEIQTW